MNVQEKLLLFLFSIILISFLLKRKKKLDKTEVSRLVGENLAKKAKEKKISQVIFDRNGYPYHGRIKAFADGVRDGGLKI